MIIEEKKGPGLRTSAAYIIRAAKNDRCENLTKNYCAYKCTKKAKTEDQRPLEGGTQSKGRWRVRYVSVQKCSPSFNFYASNAFPIFFA